MRSTACLLLAASLLACGVILAAPATAATPARYLVGYDPAERDLAHVAIAAAGGQVARSSSELGVALVLAEDPQNFERVARLSPYVDYVETDDGIGLAGAQWNGAQWNGAQWNGAQWNGAQWNGAQWNGAQWNGAQWNTAGWSGAQRTAGQWAAKFYREANGRINFDSQRTDPGLVWQWGSWAIHQPAVATSTPGSNTASLCVLDSGVDPQHPDIAPNFAAAYNAIDPKASADDDAGHGTHIAGIAAGRVGNAYGIAGVGNVQILSAKVLAADGTGHESDLAFGLVWCALSDAEVAVMALEATDDGPTMDRALQFAADRDVLLVASAGNGGGAVAYPARDPRVVAVAAVDGDLALASFSGRGPEVEVKAPGVNVLGPLPGGAFAFGSGTSQAAGFAAGVATLIRDAHPGFSAGEARSRLDAASAGPVLDAVVALS